MDELAIRVAEKVPSLAALFLAHAPKTAWAWPARAELDGVIAEMLSSAQGTWTDLALPLETFIPYVARRVPDDADDVGVLRRLRSADLFLACACAQGDQQAIGLIERELLPSVVAALTRMKLAPQVVEEAVQSLRKWLFVAEDEATLGIESYAGRGDLRAWLRVTATRIAFQFLREQKRELPTSEDLLHHFASVESDPELRLLKRLYQPDVKAAFEMAMGALPSREKNLLRQHFIDGLTIDALGACYRVHRATVARWLTKATDGLLRDVRRNLMKRMGTTRSQCESVMRLVQSDMHISMRRLLNKNK